uniref:Fos-1 n=1 Tax=Schmidtea mediterranea TaxID=79327 RepID=I1ZI60_SCHMD|nr:fos-1 [Schmidtea mediterranea]
MPESKNNNKENNNDMDELDIVVKSEPVTATKPFLNSHRTKNRGLTYENGRRNLKAERVSVEEMDRRAKRRERNRIAAAKCRERRQFQLDELQHQVEMLRSTEFNLQSTLKQLEAEEVELRSKLSNHNCVITESNNGEISILIPNHFNTTNKQFVPHNCNYPTTDIVYEATPVVVSSHSICRPRSLPVPCQNCSNATTDSFFDKTPSLDRIIARDDSLTPLLSPDTFTLLKGQLKTDNTPTTPIRTIDHKPNIKVNVKSESIDNMAFSWNHSIVDQLSMSCSETSNTQYLSTPTVDASFYGNESYSSQLNNQTRNSMDWNSH